jgi:8-oxo-dGTP pyrophosphatase MutT (NUDIX family)
MEKIERSAGIAIICENKMLLCHSTKSKWYGTYMPPKGNIEEGESEKEAACRETKEEVGIEIKPQLLGKRHQINYTRGKKVFKEVFIYECHIPSLAFLGLQNEILPQRMLQLEEIDDAKFMDFEEASVRILPRYKTMLEDSLK